jgi:hypothetical protein
VPIFTEKWDFGAISDFRDFQKGAFLTIFPLKKLLLSIRPNSGKRPGSYLYGFWRDLFWTLFIFGF